VTRLVAVGRLPSPPPEPARGLALASALALAAAPLSVLYGVTGALGGTAWLLGAAGAALSGATALALAPVSDRTGTGTLAGLVAAGTVGYLLRARLPAAPPEQVAADAVEHLTGHSVLYLRQADLWAVSLAPAVAFACWYFALRGRYGAAALSGVVPLYGLVLTGDAGTTAAAAGMAATFCLLGFGALAGTTAPLDRLLDVGLVAGAAFLLPRYVRVVAGTGDGDGGARPNLEESLVAAGDHLTAPPRVALSPAVRFRVDADAPAYWTAAVYDRYAGDGWERPAETRSYAAVSPMAPPPGEATTLRQRVTVETPLSVVAAAWKPLLVDRTTADRAAVGPLGDLRTTGRLEAGTEYAVVSRVPQRDPAELRAAGTDYPASVRRRYLDVEVPERVARRAREAASGAETPYDAAVAVASWLRSRKGYSLDAPTYGRDPVDAFLFAREDGYCVHFASAMAVMLRTLDVPARFVVGYTPGETVDGEYVVRGLDAHAWTEVYFPGVGWVPFDPTPAGPREEREREALVAAGEAPAGRVRTAEPTTTPTPPRTTTTAPGPDAGTETNRTAAGDPSASPTPDLTPVGALGPDRRGGESANRSFLPGTETDTASALAARASEGDRVAAVVAVVTLVLGASRLGVVEWLLRAVGMRYQRRGDSPGEDVERAFRRLEQRLERRHRPRRPGETHRQYLDALGSGADARVRRVFALYERCRYGGEVTRAEADEAVALVDEVVRGGRE